MERSPLPVAAVAGFALLAGAAQAQTNAGQQNYPARPIRIIVTTTAGSATDYTARAIGQRLTEAWGQQVVVDNRAGAGGVIGHDLAAKATPDGYTLVLSSSAGLVINPLLYKVPYDPNRDFAPISLAVINPNMLVSHPALPVRGVDQLVALATAGRKRSVATPDLPTIAETIPGYECINWYALLAPRGTPPAIVARLNVEIVKMFADPPFAQRFADQGSEPQTSTPAELAAHMRNESERWARVIKLAGLRTEH